MRVRTATAVLVLLGSGGLAALAQDKDKDKDKDKGQDKPVVRPVDRDELDKKAARAAYDATVLGTALFNKGNEEGCFWLYYGTLVPLYSLLDHRPELAASVQKSLLAVQKMESPAAAAFVLRRSLDDIMVQCGGAKLPGPVAKDDKGDKDAGGGKAGKGGSKFPLPLWDRLGNEKEIRPMVKEFLARAMRDPKVNFSRGGAFKFDDENKERLERFFVAGIAEGSGGPRDDLVQKLRGLLGEMAFTEAEFTALAKNLADVATERKIPEKEVKELMGVFATLRGPDPGTPKKDGP